MKLTQCPHCGSRDIVDGHFCGFCGTDVRTWSPERKAFESLPDAPLVGFTFRPIEEPNYEKMFEETLRMRQEASK